MWLDLIGDATGGIGMKLDPLCVSVVWLEKIGCANGGIGMIYFSGLNELD